MLYVITIHCINFVKKVVINFSFIVVEMHIKCLAVSADDGHHALHDSLYLPAHWEGGFT